MQVLTDTVKELVDEYRYRENELCHLESDSVKEACDLMLLDLKIRIKELAGLDEREFYQLVKGGE